MYLLTRYILHKTTRNAIPKSDKATWFIIAINSSFLLVFSEESNESIDCAIYQNIYGPFPYCCPIWKYTLLILPSGQSGNCNLFSGWVIKGYRPQLCQHHWSMCKVFRYLWFVASRFSSEFYYFSQHFTMVTTK